MHRIAYQQQQSTSTTAPQIHIYKHTSHAYKRKKSTATTTTKLAGTANGDQITSSVRTKREEKVHVSAFNFFGLLNPFGSVGLYNACVRVCCRLPYKTPVEPVEEEEDEEYHHRQKSSGVA